MNIELSDIVKLYNRIESLEGRVADLEAKVASSTLEENTRPEFPDEIKNSKYYGLSEYLYSSWENRIELSYDKIEDILGFSLPVTAYNLPQSYWANTEYHSYAKSWLLLGYKAKVDVVHKTVKFIKNIY